MGLRAVAFASRNELLAHGRADRHRARLPIGDRGVGYAKPPSKLALEQSGLNSGKLKTARFGWHRMTLYYGNV